MGGGLSELPEIGNGAVGGTVIDNQNLKCKISVSMLHA